MNPNTHSSPATLPPSGISPRVSAACCIAVIGIISAHWAWSMTL
jgi:hypothetical protein